MRSYSQVSPRFWTGDTGRQLRAHGKDAVLLALYLLTCPSANMLGIYYLPKPTILFELPLKEKELDAAFLALKKMGFAEYDEPTAMVFVHNMVRYQVGKRIKTHDSRMTALRVAFEQIATHRFAHRFVELHGDDFPVGTPLTVPERGVEGAVSQTVSDEVEQEQEQEQEQAAAPPRAVATLQLSDGQFAVTEVLENELAQAYPDLHIHREILDMKFWLAAHPEREHKVKGARQFITNWLKRTQKRRDDSQPVLMEERVYLVPGEDGQ